MKKDEKTRDVIAIRDTLSNEFESNYTCSSIVTNTIIKNEGWQKNKAYQKR